MPIAAVVAAAPRTALTAVFPCEVADLVMLIACCGELVDELVIHAQTQFLIHFLHLSRLQQAIERCAFLVHQSVGGDMFRLQGKRVTDVASPVVERLIGEAEHQVDADVADAVAAEAVDSLVDLLRAVTPMEKPQTFVGEGLRAHADAVDGQTAEHPRPYVVGVAFHGHLGVGPHLIHLIIYMVEQLGELVVAELTRRTATEVDGGQLRLVRQQRHLTAERVGISLTQRQLGGGVETAVDTAAGAKGYVDVEAGVRLVDYRSIHRVAGC